MGVAKILLSRIRERVQLKGLTYRQLAVELGVAESTVKRWFSAGNLDLSSLDRLCEILDLDLRELSRTADGPREDFTRKQEEFFAANEEALVVFYLVSGGMPVKKVARAFDFSESRLEKLLLELDRHRLIELHPGGHVRVLKKMSSWWDPRGPLSQKYYSLIKADFISSDFSRGREEQFFFTGNLSVSSQAMISKKLETLAAEINELYRMDQNHQPAKNITMFFGIRPWIFPVIQKYSRRRLT